MLLQEMENHPVQCMAKTNYDFLARNNYPMKQLVQRNSDGDSSPTKSGESHQEASAVSDSSLNGQHTSPQSGNTFFFNDIIYTRNAFFPPIKFCGGFA
jgi:hypothetical protein